MFIMRQLGAVLLFGLAGIFLLWAQTESRQADPAVPAPLVYAGEPLHVKAVCGEEEIQSMGMSCTSASPCPVYLELSAVEAMGERLVVAGNLHTESATLSSVVYTSADGGKTWTEPYERLRQATLDQMQFVDLTNGWISGQVVQALPRDPFFLLTNDGGQTWRKRTVFADPHLGSIEKFAFTTKNDGRLLVDRVNSGEGGRYAYFESQTGGDSWSIRKITSDAPDTASWSRPPSVAWRLRVHAPAKAYQIEKRQGQGWAVVAAFAVDAGRCAPPELELTPPPEPPSAGEPEAAPSEAVEVFQIGGPQTAKSKKKK